MRVRVEELVLLEQAEPSPSLLPLVLEVTCFPGRQSGGVGKGIK